MMKSSLRSVLSRVDRLGAEVRDRLNQRAASMSTVQRLLKGRRRAASGEAERIHPDEARDRGRALRARLAEMAG